MASSVTATRTVTPARLRSVARRFATGVTVVTSRADGAPVGMTVNSFATVSLEPATVVVAVRVGSRLACAVRRSGVFAITVLAAGQTACARRFADPKRPFGAACFAEFATHPEPSTGCLVLSDGIAYFACSAHAAHRYGDHIVLIGGVTACGPLRAAPALAFADGVFTHLDTAASDDPVR